MPQISKWTMPIWFDVIVPPVVGRTAHRIWLKVGDDRGEYGIYNRDTGDSSDMGSIRGKFRNGLILDANCAEVIAECLRQIHGFECERREEMK